MTVFLAMLIAIATQQPDRAKTQAPKGPTELTIPIENGDQEKVIEALSSIEFCQFDCPMGCDMSGYPQSSLWNCPKCGMALKTNKLPLKDQIQVTLVNNVATLKYPEKVQASYILVSLSEIDKALKGVDAARRWKSLTINGPFQIHTTALEYKDTDKKDMGPKRDPDNREPRKEPLPLDEPRKTPPEENQNRQQADQSNPDFRTPVPEQDQPKRAEPAPGLTAACDRLTKVIGIRSCRVSGSVLYVEAENASWDSIKDSLGQIPVADVSWIVFPAQGRIGFSVK